MNSGCLGDLLLGFLHHLELLRREIATGLNPERAGRLAVRVHDDVRVRPAYLGGCLVVIKHGITVCDHATAVE